MKDPVLRGTKGARWESSAVVKAIRLWEITPDKSSSSRLGVCREASSLTHENYLLKKASKPEPYIGCSAE